MKSFILMFIGLLLVCFIFTSPLGVLLFKKGIDLGSDKE